MTIADLVKPAQEALIKQFVDDHWAGFAGPAHCEQVIRAFADRFRAEERERCLDLIAADFGDTETLDRIWERIRNG